ncbi:MAG TPA: hypothetical protein PLD30_11040 [Candidatus Competibacteraceae bacterium]|nr:hypothetical protein [Candidatus Competibacteraceae bacterium]
MDFIVESKTIARFSVALLILATGAISWCSHYRRSSKMDWMRCTREVLALDDAP